MDWSALGLAALFGALGGLVLDLVKDRTLDLPRRLEGAFYAGFITDILAGAVGGVLVYALDGGGAGLSTAMIANILSGSGLAGLLKAAGYDPMANRQDF